MKKLLLIILISILTLSCRDNKKDDKLENNKTEKIDNTKKINKVLKEFKSLYNELLSFKNKSDFIKYGFGKGGKYDEWMVNVQTLRKNPDAKLLIQKGILVSELEQLGMSYVASKGKETKVTEEFNKIFSVVVK